MGQSATYYIRNGQGDIIGLSDDGGKVIKNVKKHMNKSPNKGGSGVAGETRKFWTTATDFKSTKVYQRTDLINLSAVDKMGGTNL